MEWQPATIVVVALMGMTAYLAIHHLSISFARRYEPLHLWLGLWCGFSLLIQVGRGIQYSAATPAMASLGMRIALGTSFVLVWLLVGLCAAVTRRRLDRRLFPLFGVLNAVFLLATLTTSAVVTNATQPHVDPIGNRYLWVEMGPLFPLVAPYASCVFLLGASWILRAVELGRSARLFLLASFGIYFAIGLNDLLLAQGLVDSVACFEAGSAVLALTFDAYALRRFHRLYHHLEDEVELRTDQLRHALHEAEAGTRAKSAFLANMSHEIRTPMNGVIGTLRLLLDSPLPSESRRFAEIAFRSAHALLRLLDDILDLAKIEAGRLLTDEQPFDPCALVQEVAALHRASCDEKAIALQIEIEPDVPPRVSGDSFRIRQILNNLVRNAVKFTDEGSIAIALRNGRGRSDRATLVFEVADTGPGIAPELQGRLFKPFVQVDPSSTRRHGGTGLGLAISSQLAASMGGELRLASKAGEGSLFSLVLSLAISTAIDDEPPAPEGPAATSAPSTGKALPPLSPSDDPFGAHASRTKATEEGPDTPVCADAGLRSAPRVLLAEDNSVNELVATALLLRLGCRVEIARNGREAVEALRMGSFDLVLMDCQMPEMDGFEATRRVREADARKPRPRHLPIIALTAHAMVGDRERCLDAGMDEYITKPIDPEALRAVIERWT